MKRIQMIILVFTLLFVLSACDDTSVNEDGTCKDNEILNKQGECEDEVENNNANDSTYDVMTFANVLLPNEEGNEEVERYSFEDSTLTKNQVVEDCVECYTNNISDNFAYQKLRIAWDIFNSGKTSNDLVEGEYFVIEDGKYPKTITTYYYEVSNNELYFEYYKATINGSNYYVKQEAYAVSLYHTGEQVEANVLYKEYKRRMKEGNDSFTTIEKVHIDESGLTNHFNSVNDTNVVSYTYSNEQTDEFVYYKDSVGYDYYRSYNPETGLYSDITINTNGNSEREFYKIIEDGKTVMTLNVQEANIEGNYKKTINYNMAYIDGWDAMNIVENPHLNRTNRYDVTLKNKGSNLDLGSTFEGDFIFSGCYMVLSMFEGYNVFSEEMYSLDKYPISFTHTSYEVFNAFITDAKTLDFYEDLYKDMSDYDFDTSFIVELNDNHLIDDGFAE